jgi:fatty acid desaturase
VAPGGGVRAGLKQELDAAGLLALRPGAVYRKALVLAALTAGFLLAFALVSPWVVRVPLFLASVATSVAFVMLGHESGHGSISRTPFVNDLLGYLTFPLVGGVSLNFWRHKHGLHHAFVNVHGKDPDIVIYPFAMNRGERAAHAGFASLVQRVQGFAFWPLALLTVFAFRLDSLRFLLGAGRRFGSRRDRVFDALGLAAHGVLWGVVPTAVLHVPLATSALFYLCWTLAAGLLLAAIFIPAHTPFPVYSAATDNVALQLDTTQNLRMNRLFSWLLCGLDQQVEHHLFPRMSHLQMKAASPIVRAHCGRQALPYREQGWAAALWTSSLRVHALRDVVPAPQPARPPAARGGAR